VLKSADLHRRVKPYLRFFGPGVLNRLMKYWMPVGKRVIVIGGTIHGCELAEFLVKRGKKVTIVDSTDIRGEGMIHHLQQQLFYWFEKNGVVIMPRVKFLEITRKGMIVEDKDGQKQSIEADTIITALPLVPNTTLLDKIKTMVPEVYAIGDCRQPQLIVDAIADGSRVAHNL
jgi:2,4-dienoyl-CoA reductase (NADPH2)